MHPPERGRRDTSASGGRSENEPRDDEERTDVPVGVSAMGSPVDEGIDRGSGRSASGGPESASAEPQQPPESAVGESQEGAAGSPNSAELRCDHDSLGRGAVESAEQPASPPTESPRPTRSKLLQSLARAVAERKKQERIEAELMTAIRQKGSGGHPLQAPASGWRKRSSSAPTAPSTMMSHAKGRAKPRGAVGELMAKQHAEGPRPSKAPKKDLAAPARQQPLDRWQETEEEIVLRLQCQGLSEERLEMELEMKRKQWQHEALLQEEIRQRQQVAAAEAEIAASLAQAPEDLAAVYNAVYGTEGEQALVAEAMTSYGRRVKPRLAPTSAKPKAKNIIGALCEIGRGRYAAHGWEYCCTSCHIKSMVKKARAAVQPQFARPRLAAH